MSTRSSAWPRLMLTAALAVLIGAGAWLVAGAQAHVQPAPASTQSPVAAPAPLPSVNLRALPQTGPAPRPARCGAFSLAGADGAWLADWLDDPNRASLITGQAQNLRLLDFSWLQLGSSAAIITEQNNSGASPLGTVLATAATANPCGLRFVTVSDARTPKSVMARVLLDPQARWSNVSALATVMAGYPQADGLTLDYEYALPVSQDDLSVYAAAAGWRGLTVREEIGRITAGYTEFVRELALAMHRQHRALRVAVMVRTTDELNYIDPSGIPGFLYDYGNLASYADQIVLMAVDFHWNTGDPGPIVTLADLKAVLNEIRTYNIPAARLAIESPAYGYDWTVDRAGHLLAGTAATTLTTTDITGKGWRQTGSKDGETSYQYTVGNTRHIVWFGGTGLAYQAGQLRHLYPGCAIVAWATGNADPAGSELITQALRT